MPNTEFAMAMKTAYPFIRIVFYFAVCLSISIIDIRSKRIPDFLSLGSLAILLALDLLIDPIKVPWAGLAALLAFLCFLALRLATKEIGFGDVKFAASLAYFSGLELLPATFFTAAACGLAYALLAIKFLGKSPRDRIPFGPFLAVGALVPMLNVIFFR